MPSEFFNEEQIAQLNQELDQSRLKQRRERGQTLTYLETWDVIKTANEIFGFDGWSTGVDNVSAVEGLGIYAIVRVESGGVSRSDVGFCRFPMGRDATSPNANQYETAVKGAVSDGLKRAMRTFGAQFGNSLYDEENPLREDAQQQQQQPRQRQQSQQRQQQPKQEQAPAQPKSIKDEVLEGQDLRFKEYVESNGVNWEYFVTIVLSAETWAGYLASDGTRRGSLEAFTNYCADQGIELPTRAS